MTSLDSIAQNWKDRPVIGLEGDPVVQMLTTKQNGGPHTVASHHTLLAAGDLILGLGSPLRIVLRRIGPDQSPDAWYMSIKLALAMIDAHSGSTIELACLTADACRELKEIAGPRIGVLPAPVQARGRKLDAIWSPDRGRIDIPCLGTHMSDAAVSWARLASRLRIETAPDAPDDCTDIAAFASQGLSASAAQVTTMPVLVVVPNGIGLGHLTRQLAIARHCKNKGLTVRFWCYSQAAGLIARSGFEVIVRQTAEHLRTDEACWILHETSELVSYLKHSGTKTVVQDGGRISPAVASALRSPEVGDTSVALVRRGMRPSGTKVEWRDTEQICDLVLEPVDLALDADDGATKESLSENSGFAQFVRAAPTLLVDKGEQLSRSEARRKCGLLGAERYCLVNLGGDALVSHTGAMLLLRQAAREAGVRLVWLASPLAASKASTEQGDQVLHSFPTAHLFRAFDGIVTAAGYNSFHEALLLSDLPVLFVPRQHPTLDDQLRRARFASDNGWAQLLDIHAAQQSHSDLSKFFDVVGRCDRVKRDIEWNDGALEMAELIAEMAIVGPFGRGRD